MALVLLAACGVVLTPQPTSTPTASAVVAETPVDVLSTPSLALTPAEVPFRPTPVTATPIASPTPVIHVVQADETLLGIAMQYGVSVAALQAANGIDNPALLRISQELVIPPAAPGEEGPPQPGLLLPTPTPSPVEVRGVVLYETPVGSLVCLGEVYNASSVALISIQVRIVLVDAGGNYLADDDVFVPVDVLNPDQSAPFSVVFLDPPPGYAGYSVTVLRSQPAGGLAGLYVPVELAGVSGVPSGPRYLVSGTVLNAGDGTAGTVSVVATVYDEQGNVTGFCQLDLEGVNLGPGAGAPFSMLVSPYRGTPKRFSVVAFANRVD